MCQRKFSNPNLTFIVRGKLLSQQGGFCCHSPWTSSVHFSFQRKSALKSLERSRTFFATPIGFSALVERWAIECLLSTWSFAVPLGERIRENVPRLAFDRSIAKHHLSYCTLSDQWSSVALVPEHLQFLVSHDNSHREKMQRFFFHSNSTLQWLW